MRARIQGVVLAAATCILPGAPPQNSLREDVTVVLYSREDPAIFRTTCPAQRCRSVAVEEFHCPRMPVDAVILTGHRDYPRYVRHDAADIAAAIKCLSPRVVVLDVCHSMDALLIDRIAASGIAPIVVGALGTLPPEGFIYEEPFFRAASAEERAAAVHTRSGARIERWRVHAPDLDAAHREFAKWGPDALQAKIVSILPNLVAMPLPGTDASVLVEVPPERFRRRR